MGHSGLLISCQPVIAVSKDDAKHSQRNGPYAFLEMQICHIKYIPVLRSPLLLHNMLQHLPFEGGIFKCTPTLHTVKLFFVFG